MFDDTDQTERPRKLFKPRPGAAPPEMAGRTWEMETIGEFMDGLIAKERGTRPLVLFGPRGVGKTALVDKVAEKWGSQADIIQATPSADLLQASVGAICSLLSSDKGFWKKFAVDEMVVGSKSSGQVRFTAKLHSEERAALLHILGECADRPKMLIVDEAHDLAEYPSSASRLLNVCQFLSRTAPFLLMLAGTPDLPSRLSELRATFMRFGKKIPMGPLTDEAAREALTKPLCKYIRSFDSSALEKIVEDAKGYPYFLQIWGEQLWEIIYKNNLTEITDSMREQVEPEVWREKDDLYGGYFNDLLDPAHLDGAIAVIQAFGARKSLHLGIIKKAVVSTIDDSLDMKTRTRQANEIIDYLASKDVLWEPVSLQMKPAIPSFHKYIRDQEAEMSNDPENRPPI